MKVADYISQSLSNAGLDTVFMITGGGAMHLNDALARNKHLKTFYFHHEQSLSIATEGYARLKNKPAIVNVTTGPGGINALNGVFGAYVDSIPMVIISGQVKRETTLSSTNTPLRQLGDQEAPIHEIAKPMVKYMRVLEKAEDVGLAISEALHLCQNGRPGPVWIDIPGDIQSSQINFSKLTKFDEKKLKTSNYICKNTKYFLSNYPRDLNLNRIDQFFRLLKSSKRPCILVGTGVKTDQERLFFKKFVKMLGIPVLTGWNAHDRIESDSRFFVGRPGTVGDRPGNFITAKADLIIVLGCRLNIRQISYNWKSFAEAAKVCMVDIDKAELEKPTLSIDLKLHAYLQSFLDLAVRYIQERDYKSLQTHKKFLLWSKQVYEAHKVKKLDYKKRKKLNPYHFLIDYFDKIPPRSVTVTANGSACVIGFQAAFIKKQQRLFTNSGCASMGYDLPAALGASIAAKTSQNIYCLAGDGSLMMNIQELETLRYYKLPIKLFILHNNGYASIKQTQQNYFPDNVNGTDPSNGVGIPDFEKICKAFGINTSVIRSEMDFSSKKTLSLLTNKKPHAFVVYLDDKQGFEPKLASRMNSNGQMESPKLFDMFPFFSKESIDQIMDE